jgi:hypothetical protein
MKRPSAHFHVIGLMNDTTLIGPESVEGKNKFLESHGTYSLVGRDASMFALEMTCQASKNAFPLSRNKPLEINGLQIASYSRTSPVIRPCQDSGEDIERDVNCEQAIF